MASSSSFSNSFAVNSPLLSRKVVGIGKESSTSHTNFFSRGKCYIKSFFSFFSFVPAIGMVVVAHSKAIEWKVSTCEEPKVVRPPLIKRESKDNFFPILDPEYF